VLLQFQLCVRHVRSCLPSGWSAILQTVGRPFACLLDIWLVQWRSVVHLQPSGKESRPALLPQTSKRPAALNGWAVTLLWRRACKLAQRRFLHNIAVPFRWPCCKNVLSCCAHLICHVFVLFHLRSYSWSSHFSAVLHASRSLRPGLSCLSATCFCDISICLYLLFVVFPLPMSLFISRHV